MNQNETFLQVDNVAVYSLGYSVVFRIIVM